MTGKERVATSRIFTLIAKMILPRPSYLGDRRNGITRADMRKYKVHAGRDQTVNRLRCLDAETVVCNGWRAHKESNKETINMAEHDASILPATN